MNILLFKLTSVLLTIVVFSMTMNAQVDSGLAAQLQNFLDNSVSNSGNNGVSAYLIMPDGSTWDGQAGVGAQEQEISDSTLFIGASTTKFNVALLMLLLAEDGLVELDMPWPTYLSLDLPFNPDITVRQLLNHSSGIADYLETASSGGDITNDFEYFFTPQFILENVVSENPVFAPGTNFQYSNSNYVMAGLIIEAVTGNPLHEELHDRVWEPMSMEHTYLGAYDIYTEPLAGVWWNFGSGQTNYSDTPSTSMLSYAYGAGNIVSTPADLAKLLGGMLNGELIDASSLSEMMEFVPASFGSWTAGYGLGLHHANVGPDDTALGHDGYYANLTDMFHSEEYGFTRVTMTNTQTTWFGLFDPMYEIISEHLLSTGLMNSDRSEKLSIHPNPSQGQVTISGLLAADDILIQDITGRVILKDVAWRSSYSIVLDEPGVYLVTILSEQGSYSQSLVVN